MTSALFLRFINPAVLFPRQWCIYRPIFLQDSAHNKTLLLVGKVLEAIANESPFREGSELAFLNDFILKSAARFKFFIFKAAIPTHSYSRVLSKLNDIISQKDESWKILEFLQKLIDEYQFKSSTGKLDKKLSGLKELLKTTKLQKLLSIVNFSNLRPDTCSAPPTLTSTQILCKGDSLPDNRTWHSINTLGQYVIIFGGLIEQENGRVYSGDTQIFTLKTILSKPTLRYASRRMKKLKLEESGAKIISPRAGHATATCNSTVYLFGGLTEAGYSNEMFAFTIDGGWKLVKTESLRFPSARAGHCWSN